MIFGQIVIDKEETKRCPANVTPGNNPRLLDLAEFDREHSTGTKDNYVRAIERMLVEHLMPLYLKELFGQNGWRPYLGDENCGDWHGIELVNTEEVECIEGNFRIETIVMTFRMGAKLTNAFSLPEESVACSFHSFPLELNDAFRSSALETLKNVFEQIEEIPTPIPGAKHLNVGHGEWSLCTDKKCEGDWMFSLAFGKQI